MTCTYDRIKKLNKVGAVPLQHSLQAAPEAAGHVLDVVTVHVLPCVDDGLLQRVLVGVPDLVDIPHQTQPNCIVKGIEIRTGWRPHCLWPELHAVPLEKVGRRHGCVTGALSCWNTYSPGL